jgi:adenine-specific DNA-methyltransferase
VPLLSWHDRDQDLTRAARAPYRLLEPVASLSYGEADAQNLLIEGDNLDALKALLPYYAGQVKCIFIDPPYNTRSAFEHYDDNLEHSQWLSMMYPRLELLRELLAEDGSLWVTLDDNEAHYFKVICDEILGRSNFLANVVWEKADSPRMDADFFSTRHDHLFVFAKSKEKAAIRRVPDPNEDLPEHYDQVDQSGRPYYLKPLRAMGGQGETREARPNLHFAMIAPDGSEVFPKLQNGRDGAWRWSETKVEAEKDRIEWKQGRKGWTPYYRIFGDGERALRPPETIWRHTDVGSNRTSKAEVKRVLDGEAFGTPKPEALIRRILEISSNPSDLVLDSFLGSGTTAAVAHKMGRRWIGIEMGEHARTHCQPRLKKVVDGEQGGISEAVGWQGGGGFRYYKLGAPVFDENGHIRADIRFEQLAAHVWFAETGAARSTRARKEAFLGAHGDTGYYLLFNGILGDDSKSGGNVLTRRVLRSLPAFEGPKVIYGEACALPEEQLRELDIAFRQTPYDIRAR